MAKEVLLPTQCIPYPCQLFGSSIHVLNRDLTWNSEYILHRYRTIPQSVTTNHFPIMPIRPSYNRDISILLLQPIASDNSIILPIIPSRILSLTSSATSTTHTTSNDLVLATITTVTSRDSTNIHCCAQSIMKVARNRKCDWNIRVTLHYLLRAKLENRRHLFETAFSPVTSQTPFPTQLRYNVQRNKYVLSNDNPPNNSLFPHKKARTESHSASHHAIYPNSP
jgi:hypothetical protein